MVDLQLRQREARLVYLAILYHLGRPGSEVDPVTRQPHERGLAPVREVLEAHIGGTPEHAILTLALSEYQLGRLGEALLGLVNELKQVDLSGRSVVAGLVESLARVFPDELAEAGLSGTLDLAGEATMLRRRLAGAIREANAALDGAREEQVDASSGARRWWKVWVH